MLSQDIQIVYPDKNADYYTSVIDEDISYHYKYILAINSDGKSCQTNGLDKLGVRPVITIRDNI